MFTKNENQQKINKLIKNTTKQKKEKQQYNIKNM